MPGVESLDSARGELRADGVRRDSTGAPRKMDSNRLKKLLEGCYLTVPTVFKDADLAVWDKNPYAVPAASLKDLVCEMTLVRGRVVYRR